MVNEPISKALLVNKPIKFRFISFFLILVFPRIPPRVPYYLKSAFLYRLSGLRQFLIVMVVFCAYLSCHLIETNLCGTVKYFIDVINFYNHYISSKGDYI